MSAAPALRLGFLGCGKMGNAMASNLLKAGCKLFVCDTNADAVKDLAAKQGAQIIETPRKLASVTGKQNPANLRIYSTLKSNTI